MGYPLALDPALRIGVRDYIAPRFSGGGTGRSSSTRMITRLFGGLHDPCHEPGPACPITRNRPIVTSAPSAKESGEMRMVMVVDRQGRVTGSK